MNAEPDSPAEKDVDSAAKKKTDDKEAHRLQGTTKKVMLRKVSPFIFDGYLDINLSTIKPDLLRPRHDSRSPT